MASEPKVLIVIEIQKNFDMFRNSNFVRISDIKNKNSFKKPKIPDDKKRKLYKAFLFINLYD